MNSHLLIKFKSLFQVWNYLGFPVFVVLACRAVCKCGSAGTYSRSGRITSTTNELMKSLMKLKEWPWAFAESRPRHFMLMTCVSLQHAMTEKIRGGARKESGIPQRALSSKTSDISHKHVMTKLLFGKIKPSVTINQVNATFLHCRKHNFLSWSTNINIFLKNVLFSWPFFCHLFIIIIIIKFNNSWRNKLNCSIINYIFFKQELSVWGNIMGKVFKC